MVTRRQPQKSGMAKVVDGLAGALPGGRAKNAGRGGVGKAGAAGGLAVLAGAAGLALKNRDKLQAMIARKGGDTEDRAAHADAPANPVIVNERPGPAVGTGTIDAPAAGPPLAAEPNAAERLGDRRDPLDPTDRPAP